MNLTYLNPKIMKKNYILPLLFILLTTVSFGQITLTQSTDNSIVSLNSVSCSAGGVVSDNTFYRAFDITSYGSVFNVLEVSFGVEAVSNPSPNFAVDVIIYSNTGGAFPAGTLTEIARVSVPLDDTATGTIVDVPITATVNAPQLVFAVQTPNESGGTAPNNTTGFQIGSNPNGQTNPGYISSAGCGITTPSTLASIGFNDMHLVMEVRDFLLSVDDYSLENSVSVYPNPTNDFINLKVSTSTNIKSAELFNIIGKQVIKAGNTNTLDLTNLESGVYLLKVTTDLGSLTKKIIRN